MCGGEKCKSYVVALGLVFMEHKPVLEDLLEVVR